LGFATKTGTAATFSITLVSNFVKRKAAYFETRTGLGLGPGLGLEENPDSRKTRTRKKSGLVLKKTRT
jgi:hypothetical protein